MSEQYPISRDKHIATTGSNRGRKPKYPFKSMQPGDSFPFHRDEYDRVLWSMAQFQSRSNPAAKFRISLVDLIVERVK
jgi:hypothetical protein